MKIGYLVASLLAAGAVVISLAAPLTLGHLNFLGSANDHGGHEDQNDQQDNDMDDENETMEMNETEELVPPAAGGGGWFNVKNATGVVFKDTFGLELQGNRSLWNTSGFVFQGRDASVRIQPTNFTKINLMNMTEKGKNFTMADAWGWAKANGVEGYWFHLVLVDKGNRSSDVLDLSVFKDTNKTWKMDETTPTWHWIATGLDGGMIHVVLAGEMHDEMDNDTPDEMHEDTEDD